MNTNWHLKFVFSEGAKCSLDNTPELFVQDSWLSSMFEKLAFVEIILTGHRESGLLTAIVKFNKYKSNKNKK